MNNTQTLPNIQACQTEEYTSYVAKLQDSILPEFVSSEGNLNWGRLICNWHEKKGHGQIVTHTYAACVDGYEGSIYIDCRPRKILAKCFAHLFARPFHALAKTIYHLSLYPIFVEIAKFNHPDCPKKEKIKNIFKSLADIILTPLYGVVLTVATLAVIIISPFSPEYLYEGRKLLGKIEVASNWGIAHTKWTLAECFQPYPLSVFFEKYGQRDFANDTVYPDESMFEKALGNFARANIKHRHKTFDYFSCGKLPVDVVYQSPILEYS